MSLPIRVQVEACNLQFRNPQPNKARQYRGGNLGKRRAWLSLIVFCTLLVAGSALAFAMVIAGASVEIANHQSTKIEEAMNVESTSVASSSSKTFSGLISDSSYGARRIRR